MSIQSVFYIEQRNEIQVFESCFKNQIPLLLKGPTGCGKSQLVEHMALQLDRPLIKVACNEDTNAADLLGRFLLKDGETVWQDGPVTRAVRQNAILYLDEFAEAREDVMVAIHPLTDHRRELYVDKTNETLKAQTHFMVVASYNPGYQQGAREIKPSTKQRFAAVSMNYLNKKDEASLLINHFQVNEKVAEQLAELAFQIRSKPELMLKETVSTRLLVQAGLMIRSGVPARRACYAAIAEVLSDDLKIISALKDFIDLKI